MLRKIYPENPNSKEIEKIVEILRSGGVIIYPTDTLYGIGCDIFQHKSIERVARIKGVRVEDAQFSIICHDLSHLSDYSKPLDNAVFKLMKRCLPGPFTFILNASNKVPKIFMSRKKTIGIRVPDNNIILEIVRELGNPILTTSVKEFDDMIEYTTDPELIHDKYENLVDLVIDGGIGEYGMSTIIDCTGSNPLIVREGLGTVDL